MFVLLISFFVDFGTCSSTSTATVWAGDKARGRFFSSLLMFNMFEWKYAPTKWFRRCLCVWCTRIWVIKRSKILIIFAVVPRTLHSFLKFLPLLLSLCFSIYLSFFLFIDSAFFLYFLSSTISPLASPSLSSRSSRFSWFLALFLLFNAPFISQLCFPFIHIYLSPMTGFKLMFMATMCGFVYNLHIFCSDSQRNKIYLGWKINEMHSFVPRYKANDNLFGYCKLASGCCRSNSFSVTVFISERSADCFITICRIVVRFGLNKNNNY